MLFLAWRRPARKPPEPRCCGLHRFQALLARLKPGRSGVGEREVAACAASRRCWHLQAEDRPLPRGGCGLVLLPAVVGTGGRGQVRIHGNPNARRGGQKRAGGRGTAFRTDLDAAGGGATGRKKAAIPRRTPGRRSPGRLLAVPARSVPAARTGARAGGVPQERPHPPTSIQLCAEPGRGRPAGLLVTRPVPAARPRMTDPARCREGASQDPAMKRGEPPRMPAGCAADGQHSRSGGSVTARSAGPGVLSALRQLFGSVCAPPGRQRHGWNRTGAPHTAAVPPGAQTR